MRFSLALAITVLCTAALPQCMRVTDGIEVDLAYLTEPTPFEIRTDLGYRIRLDRALVAVGQVELIRCDNSVADLWELFGAARARAHVLDTPTSLGEPLVLDLMEGAGTPEYAGTMKPPPGRYCGVRLVGMPADADAPGLDEKNQEMTEHTVLVEGRVRAEGEETQTELFVPITDLLECELPLDRPLVFESPIVENISIRIDHRSWFDGIDFALLSEDAVRERITENVQSSLQAALPNQEDGF